MGFIKQREIEQQEKGYSFIGDKFVCYKCIDNPDVSSFISKNATNDTCSYCSCKSRKNISIHIHSLIEFLLESISMEWGNLDDECVQYETAEGGYLLKVYDSYDLFDFIDLNFSNDKIRNEIILNALNNQLWCKIDPYGMSYNEELIFNWEQFSYVIKHKTRYVFYKLPPENDDIYSQPFNIYDILEKVGEIIIKYQLFKILPAGTEAYRGRIEDYIINPDYIELGTPVRSKAIKPNRMSPAGIPMFYCSFSRDVVELELIDKSEKKPRKERFLTTGKFIILKDLFVVNFTTIPKVPSLFNQANSKNRASLIFIRNFISDLSKPICNDGKEHIEYVPTQVLTEFIRYVLKVKGSPKIDGIIFPCSKSKKESSCTLFVESENCTQDDLSLVSKLPSPDFGEKFLKLITASVLSKKI